MALSGMVLQILAILAKICIINQGFNLILETCRIAASQYYLNWYCIWVMLDKVYVLIKEYYVSCEVVNEISQ